MSRPQHLNPSKNVCDSSGSKHCAELDYKTATTPNLISPIYYFFFIQVPRSFGPSPLTQFYLSTHCRDHLSLFLRDSASHPPYIDSTVFIAQMSFLAFNPPFRPEGSRGAFWTQWSAFLIPSPSNSHFLVKTLSASEGENELFPL